MNITAYSVVIIKMKTNPTATLDIKAKMKFPVKEILLSEERIRIFQPDPGKNILVAKSNNMFTIPLQHTSAPPVYQIG